MNVDLKRMASTLSEMSQSGVSAVAEICSLTSDVATPSSITVCSGGASTSTTLGGGGVKLENFWEKKPKINSVGGGGKKKEISRKNIGVKVVITNRII